MINTFSPNEICYKEGVPFFNLSCCNFVHFKSNWMENGGKYEKWGDIAYFQSRGGGYVFSAVFSSSFQSFFPNMLVGLIFKQNDYTPVTLFTEKVLHTKIILLLLNKKMFLHLSLSTFIVKCDNTYPS